MLLKRRPPRLDNRLPERREGFDQIDARALAVLQWLKSNRIEFVLVGPVAATFHGCSDEAGPVAIVPAPYRRNLERLARALESERACLRVDGAGTDGGADTTPIKPTADKLARGRLWTLRCGSHDLDIEGDAPGIGSYQELLYEATSFEPVSGLSIEVACPEDIETYAHVRRTGTAPEIRVLRTAPV